MSNVSIDWSKVDQPEAVFQRFPSRRSVVYGTKGIVCSSQPLATEAGLEILRKGGNAADAAVATSAALNVTEPSCCGIGGDAFCLFYNASTKKVSALNGSGRAPAKLTIDYIHERGIRGSIPHTDLNSVTVPGAAAAWLDTIKLFGGATVSPADIFAPAIRLAEEGVPVSEIHGVSWKKSENLIKTASPNGDEMLLHGKAPLPGEVVKLPHLAQTFRELVTHGRDGFYTGRIAQAIVDLVQSRGGVMELEDLASHKSSVVQPIQYTYANDVTVYECPPNGQGLTALLALGILESLQEQGLVQPLLEMEHNSADYLHALIEALRLAFADTQYYVTDPDTAHVPVEALLSKASEYLASRASLFNPRRTNPKVIHVSPISPLYGRKVEKSHLGEPGELIRYSLLYRYCEAVIGPKGGGMKCFYAVTDRWGNACSYIQSNYDGFGTGAIPKGCGFTLQNRGSGFSLDKDHPNALKGGKRPYHTIIPAIATRGDQLFLSYGVMGGYMQPQGHVQVLLNVLRGFTPQAALDAPRFCISAGIPGAESSESGKAGDVNSEVYFEDGFSKEVVETLRAMGHDARYVGGFDRGLMGRGQIIQKLNNPTGQLVWAAGSDPRADGHAAAQI